MISFGIDIGTTTLRAAAVDVTTSPLGERRVVSVAEALCAFTPYDEKGLLDEKALFAALDQWIASNHLATPEVGTALFTGEAQRAPNCRAVGEALLARWPGLLCAQLDPHLESLVAAHGAGAVELSGRHLGKTVVHIDIGGGTANFARILNGSVVETACLDAGGRKWVVDPSTGKILRKTRIAEWLEKEHRAETQFTGESARKMAVLLADAIVRYSLGETVPDPWIVAPWKSDAPKKPLISLSGGVVECWETPEPPFRYGDLGPLLAEALRKNLAAHRLETHLSRLEGRATALGISAFGFQVSGNSLHGEDFHRLRNVPLRNAEDFLRKPILPAQCAIDVEISDVSAASLDSVAAGWAHRLHSVQLVPGALVVFLMKPNVAKAFGWFFRRHAGRAPIAWAIDGIDTTLVPAGPVRTLDVGDLGADGRLPIVVKTLRPF